MKRNMYAALVILGICLVFGIADAKTKTKRSYNWDTGEHCTERCTTDYFGNERCREYCY